MENSRLALLIGSLAAVRHQRTLFTDALRKAVGITDAAWDSFVGHHWWAGPEAEEARSTANKVLNASFRMSGVHQPSVLAEKVAAVIAVYVHPANWELAAVMLSGGLDGVKLLVPTGEEHPREVVGPERMLSLVYAMHHHDHDGVVYRELPAEEESE